MCEVSLSHPSGQSLPGAALGDPDVSGGRDMDCPERRQAAVALPPDDALVDILSRVPAKPRFRFKCVSKAWCDLIADRVRGKKFPQTLEGFFSGSSREKYEHFTDLLGRSVPFVDPSFSFLTKLPGIHKIILLGSCNGLVLFGHRLVSDTYDSLGYIVCNPATEQWVAVPSSGQTPSPRLDDWDDEEYALTYLIFNPAVSSHFKLVQFWQNDQGVMLQSRQNHDGVAVVRTYSSESGAWSETANEWRASEAIISYAGSAFVNGMLHFMVYHIPTYDSPEELIVVVDGEGKKYRIIRWPMERGNIAFVGQSQGHLHCMSGHLGSESERTELSIWVLEDYNTEEWVLKHSVSFVQLFGRLSCMDDFDYEFVSIHPDRNLVFFVQRWNWKLISYDMDSKEVCALCSLGHGYECITPYVPYFAESSALAKKD